MQKIVILLVLLTSSLAQANLAKDLSNLFCSEKYRARAEAALFPTDGSEPFFPSSAQDPERWYSTDKNLLASLCRGARFDFPELLFLGVSRAWLCGHLVYKCVMASNRDGNENPLEKQPSPIEEVPGDDDVPSTPDDDIQGDDDETGDDDSFEDPTDEDTDGNENPDDGSQGDDGQGPIDGPAF